MSAEAVTEWTEAVLRHLGIARQLRRELDSPYLTDVQRRRLERQRDLVVAEAEDLAELANEDRG